MKIALDISPLKRGNFLQHRVRGTGFYTKNLQESLTTYFPQNSYAFFTKQIEIPKDCDIVHIPYFEPFFLTLPLVNRFPTVVTVHDLTPLVFPQHFPRGLKGEIKWRIQKKLLQKAQAIITDSMSSKKDIVKYADISENKVNVVYLAVGKEFRQLKIKNLKLKIAQKYHLPKKFALYVGDATWNKNLPLLIQAIKRTFIPLVMVGKAVVEKNFDKSNPWNQDLVTVQRLVNKNPYISCLGFVPTEDLVDIYNLATVFIMPSLYEGFGLPILEAMQCGCPVISSKEGSIFEVADEAAYYVNAYDVNNIAEGIKKVFQNKSLQQELSKKGLLQAKKFSWEKTVVKTMKVYEKNN